MMYKYIHSHSKDICMILNGSMKPDKTMQQSGSLRRGNDPFQLQWFAPAISARSVSSISHGSKGPSNCKPPVSPNLDLSLQSVTVIRRRCEQLSPWIPNETWADCRSSPTLANFFSATAVLTNKGKLSKSEN